MAHDDTREHVSADASLPAVNSLLRVLLGAQREGAVLDAVARVAQGQEPDVQGRVDAGLADLPTRVEDVVPAQRRGERTHVVIAAPRYVGDVERPPDGAACALVWATQRGVIELPTEFVRTELLPQGIRVWHLAVAGQAVRLQRRAFVRVPLSVPLVVRTFRLDGDPGGSPAGREDDSGAEPALPEVVDGRTSDLSEGGLRCLLPAPPLPSDLPIEVAFAVEGDEYRLRAAVVRAMPGKPGTGLFETAIRFVDTFRGDDLRKVVFAEQLRLRRSGLD